MPLASAIFYANDVSKPSRNMKHDNNSNNDQHNHGNVHHGDRANEVADRWCRDHLFWLLADMPASSTASD
ncbi:MAG: hypothetical protein IPP40_04510 [bacterium]|nr:hypothetical protein [bacterium]